MALKKYKPITSSRRFMTGFDFSEITSKTPEKSLLSRKLRKAGRNNRGNITVRFRGGGHKRRYRLVDFYRTKMDVPATVKTVEYDPNRSSRISLIQYQDGSKGYIISPVNLKVGDLVVSSEKGADIKPGNCMKLDKVPLGSQVHNIEIRPGKGGQLVRSAGTCANLVAKEKGYVLIKLPSGEVRKILASCKATVGQVGNVENENITIGKAGRTRWLSKRPHVRGMCQNPIDHPMGGGEGKGKGNHPRTPWGKPCKGHKTRNNKSTDKYIVSRKKKKKR